MAGIGIRRTRTVLIDGNNRLTLRVSRIADGVDDNSTSDIYADGSQRVIEGFGTETNIHVTCEEVSAADIRWFAGPPIADVALQRRRVHLCGVVEGDPPGS